MLLLKALPGFATSSEVDGLTAFEDLLTAVAAQTFTPAEVANDVTSFRYDFGNTGTTETYLIGIRTAPLLINADQAPTLLSPFPYALVCRYTTCDKIS